MKRTLTFLAGIVVGALVVAALLGRYQIVACPGGGEAPTVHVFRLDRWTGKVLGEGSVGVVGTPSIQ